jgi:ketose-bisphosphate aldolase
MKFCTASSLAQRAREEGYAVPAFNTNGATYDIARAAIEAADELASPLIIQSYEPNLAYRGFQLAAYQTAFLAEGANTPIAMHLDHGSSIESAIEAIEAGFSSVMIDGSHLPLDENIRLTKQVIEAARPLGVSVEAEVGHVTGGVHSHGSGSAVTDPDEAVRLVEETGVDMLAIANGTRHGVIELQDQIDLQLVKTLRGRISVPLVQHGTSGIPLRLITVLAKAGMAKFNFGEPFRANYIKYFVEYSKTLDHGDHAWKIAQAVKDRLKQDMKELIVALGSEGKAR